MADKRRSPSGVQEQSPGGGPKPETYAEYSTERCQRTSVVHIVVTAARLTASHAMARVIGLYIQYTAQFNRIGSLGYLVRYFGQGFSHCAVKHCVVTVSE